MHHLRGAMQYRQAMSTIPRWILTKFCFVEYCVQAWLAHFQKDKACLTQLNST